MEDITKRLSEATANCLKSYEEWSKDKKSSSARESLMENVHEIRKVAARLEIEMAISERDEMAAKPIPIPPHRSQKKKHNNKDDNAGNRADGNNNDKGQGDNKPARRRSASKGS